MATAIELPFAYVSLPRLPFTKFFSLVVLANLLATLVATAVLTWLPDAVGMRHYNTQTLESDVIENGEEIHAALEKFRANHGGEVPDYIYGGDEGSWHGQDRTDRLLQEGLLEVYPRNPFQVGRGYLRTRQEWTFVGLFFGIKLPAYLYLRDVWDSVFDSGREPRFGLKGIRMGNLLSDPLIKKSSDPQRYTLSLNGVRMPGSFFYRAYDLDSNGHDESYILGVIGAEATEGIDCYDASDDALLIDHSGQLGVANDGKPDGVLWVVGGGKLNGYPWSDGSLPAPVTPAGFPPR